MAAYEIGYEDELFEHPVGHSLHCCICTNVIKDPVACRHNEHIFCRACITEHLKNYQTCPTCMDPLTVHTLSQASRGVRNLLNELKIRCKFFDRGCGNFIELGNLESHLRECGFAPAVCSNEGCALEVNKRDLLHHETAVCEQRRVKCHSCNDIRREMDIVKVNLAAINVKLARIDESLKRNDEKMRSYEEYLGKIEKKMGRNHENVETAVENVVAKVELVQEQLRKWEERNRRLEAGSVEMKKNLKRNDEKMSRNHENVKMAVENVAAKVELVQEQLKKQEESNRRLEANNFEMKKSLNEMTKQLERMTEQRLNADQAEQEQMKKGNAEAAEMDGEPKVVIAGGWNGEESINSVEMFSLSNGTWTRLQPMRECRDGVSSVVYNNQFIVMGGDVKSMEKLSLNVVRADHSITWQIVRAKLPGQLLGHCSVVYNGRLIVIGGYNTDKGAYSDRITEISLIPPYSSKVLTTMPQKRRCHGVAMFGDKIMIVGGSKTNDYSSALRTVVMYDITKNRCKGLAPLPYPVRGMATVKWGNDNVILIGGNDSNYKPLSTVLIYNFKTQESHMLPDMKCKRKGCVAAVVRDTVIVMGGKDEKGNCQWNALVSGML